MPRITFALFMCFFAGSAFACSCVSGLTECGQLSSAKVAFVGTVLEGTESQETPGKSSWGDRPAKLRVETIVRGLDSKSAEVRVNPSILTSCYFPMRAGQRWLILGNISGEVVITGGCTGSRVIPPGDSSVMDAVESFLKGPNLVRAEARKYQGWDTPYRKETLLPDVEVTLLSDGRTWSGKTNEDGELAFRGLPPGNYEVSASKPGLSLGLATDTRWDSNGIFSPKIKVDGQGCVDAHLILYPEQGIRGTVRDAQGVPMTGISVGAFEVRTGNRVSSASSRSTVTDSEGNYYLPRVPDGTYVVGANADEGFDGSPYRAKYHPAAFSSQSAARVSVQSHSVESVDILMDPPRRRMEMQVKVVLGDGQPAANAYISLKRPDVGLVRTGANEDRSQTTNSQGIATLRLWEGDEYSMYALLASKEHPESLSGTLLSDSITVKATSGTTPVLLLKARR